MKSSEGDAVESFAVKHSLVWNQMGRFSFTARSAKADTLTKRNPKRSPTPATKEFGCDALNKVRIALLTHNQLHGAEHYSRDP
jgi:hypothetical protein